MELEVAQQGWICGLIGVGGGTARATDSVGCVELEVAQQGRICGLSGVGVGTARGNLWVDMSWWHSKGESYGSRGVGGTARAADSVGCVEGGGTLFSAWAGAADAVRGVELE